VGRVLPRHRYTGARAAAELRRLLGGDYAKRGGELAGVIGSEDGLKAACDRVERCLASWPNVL
jgi:UDP:flavonoid glycosyltransferase YjiC (YdhE family)